jgi:hypothetical protein
LESSENYYIRKNTWDLYKDVVFGVKVLNGLEMVYWGLLSSNPEEPSTYTYSNPSDFESLNIGSINLGGYLYSDVYSLIHETDTFYLNKTYGFLRVQAGGGNYSYVVP